PSRAPPVPWTAWGTDQALGRALQCAMLTALPPVQEMIRRLVAIPSVCSLDPTLDTSNRQVVDQLATWAEDAGFRASVVALPDSRKCNLVAVKGRGEGGMLWAGHTDTVPCDVELWQSDPFVVEERQDALYGLGTADMKSFLAMALTAASRIDEASLRAPLLFVATADEESTMAGARALLSAGGPRATYALVGEPTDLKPIRAHKGLFVERICVTGRSGHSS